MIDVRNSVLAETSGRQERWDQSSLRSRFYFVPMTSPPPLPLGEPASEWTAIQHSTSIHVLLHFQERFQNSQWANYAAARIAELRAADGIAVLRVGDEARREGEGTAGVPQALPSMVSSELASDAPASSEASSVAATDENREPAEAADDDIESEHRAIPAFLASKANDHADRTGWLRRLTTVHKKVLLTIGSLFALCSLIAVVTGTTRSHLAVELIDFVIYGRTLNAASMPARCDESGASARPCEQSLRC